MTTAEIISLVISAGSLLVIAWNLRRSQHGDTASSAMERANMTADIRYIRGKIDEIKSETREIRGDMSQLREDINGLRERLARVEQNIEHAHSRIDRINGGNQA